MSDAFVIMTFGTESGKAVNLRIGNADPSVTHNNVRSAMDIILGSHAIKTASGDLVSKEKAVIQRVTKQDYDLS